MIDFRQHFVHEHINIGKRIPRSKKQTLINWPSRWPSSPRRGLNLRQLGVVPHPYANAAEAGRGEPGS